MLVAAVASSAENLLKKGFAEGKGTVEKGQTGHQEEGTCVVTGETL